MITCQQPVSMVVAAPIGIDFSKLSWLTPNGYTAGGTASGGPTNHYHGAVAVVDAVVLSGQNDGWGNIATMTYTGPAAACQVKITINSFSGGNASAQCLISVYQDGNQIISQNAQSSQTINFNVSAGVNSVITIGLPPVGNVIGVEVGCDIVDFPGTNFEGVATFEFLPHS